MLTKQVGQFAIATIMIETRPEDVLKLFQDVIILQATMADDGSVIQYMGISKHFRELLLDATVPMYDCECTRKEDGTMAIKWVERTTKLIQGVG